MKKEIKTKRLGKYKEVATFVETFEGDEKSMSSKVLEKEKRYRFLFRQEVRWKNNNKPACIKDGDVIEVIIDTSKKYAYARKLK